MKATLFTIFVLAAASLGAQNRPPSLFEKLTGHEGAAARLETNFETLVDNRKTEEQFAGTLTLEDGTSFPVSLSVRGKFRRNACKYPPLKVKVPKKKLVAAGLDTLNELKLILPYSDSKESGEWLVKEYLAYQMYEMLTNNSVRARLLQLKLTDTETGKQKQLYCVALEDKEETLARLKGTLVEQYGIPTEQLDLDSYALMVVFQYMIGNTDWQVETFRNIRLVKTTNAEKILTLPYDLDFSGLVNTSYARPSMDYGLAKVTDRYFMAGNIPKENLRRAIQRCAHARQELTALCQSPLVSPKTSRDMVGYLDSFFKQITPSGDLPVASTNFDTNSASRISKK